MATETDVSCEDALSAAAHCGTYTGIHGSSTSLAPTPGKMNTTETNKNVI